MKKSDIEVGAEYAAALAPQTVLTAGIRGYAGRLAHVRMIEIDHAYTVTEQTYRGGPTRDVEKRGYEVEIVEELRVKVWRGEEVWAPGDREIVETGREIVKPWAEYLDELVGHQAAELHRRAEAERTGRLWAVVAAELDRRGLSVDDPRNRSGYSRPIDDVNVPLSVLAELLGISEAPTADREEAATS